MDRKILADLVVEGRKVPKGTIVFQVFEPSVFFLICDNLTQT